ncbi:expressed unknown protein [Seminavis robusta]|uniref:Uncharacterized protein n=1 Tax=Seminavis robusta TaxID=568900 RepID=A0A9N8F208_9STRA|nr:expressed unknown protein [Seminavis robusta]|eukprot:Sro3299_g346390.1 n/a (371) ;mRNA; f:5902-7014
MNDTATISLVIVGAAAVAAPFVYGLLKCRYGGDKFSTTEKDHLTPAIDGETIASEANTDDMEDDGGIETGVHHGTLEPQSSPPPRASTQQDDAFFNLQETWTLAKFYFPGIVRGDSSEGFKSTRLIKRFLRDEVEWKLFQLRQKDRDTFLELMKPENAATLCGKIGMNETVVQRRFKVVRSIQKELGFQSKLSIQDSLDHLISTLDAKNAFGAVSKEEGGVLHISNFNGTLYDKGIVKEHEWLSYVGVTMQQNQVESALEKVTKSLEKGGFEQFPNHFMHGTTGNKLQQICELEGIMNPSKSDEAHDFGSGLYCFKGSLAKALSFGANRAWPRPDGAGGSNPAIVIFPKPDEFDEETIYHVDSNLPFGQD